ncbi:hypothetical protein FHG87_005274 [Trinorchestia longiramus]|nr:hypothetical protein FHG87_005274 [Trinorchestia longiramus]
MYQSEAPVPRYHRSVGLSMYQSVMNGACGAAVSTSTSSSTRSFPQLRVQAKMPCPSPTGDSAILLTGGKPAASISSSAGPPLITIMHPESPQAGAKVLGGGSVAHGSSAPSFIKTSAFLSSEPHVITVTADLCNWGAGLSGLTLERRIKIISIGDEVQEHPRPAVRCRSTRDLLSGAGAPETCCQVQEHPRPAVRCRSTRDLLSGAGARETCCQVQEHARPVVRCKSTETCCQVQEHRDLLSGAGAPRPAVRCRSTETCSQVLYLAPA